MEAAISKPRRPRSKKPQHMGFLPSEDLTPSAECQYSHTFTKDIPGEVFMCVELALRALDYTYTERPSLERGPFGMPMEVPFARHQVTVHGRSVTIPVGRFEVEGLGMVSMKVGDHVAPELICMMDKGVDAALFNALVDAIKLELTKDSSRVFRGNAVKIESGDDLIVPNLLDVSKDLPYILNRDVEEQLATALFLPIRHRDKLRGRVRLKRGIIMEGQYGVGKSLTAYMAARMAIANGWTYLTVQSTWAHPALKLAELLQPCVLFVEDLDEVAHGARDRLNMLLNTLSGVESKSAPELIFLVSTNFIQRLDPAILRPERIDAIITMEPPNRDTVGRLLVHYAGTLLESSSGREWDDLCAHLDGTTPAIIGEIVERAKIRAISDNSRITVAQLMGHAVRMKRQRELATPKFNSDTNGHKLAEAMYQVTNGQF